MRKKRIKAAFLIGAAALWLSACGGTEKNARPESETAVRTSEIETADAEESAGAEDNSAAETKAGADGETAGIGEAEAAKETQERHGVFEVFEAADLDGNAVNQDIFKDYDLTMINIWATFCGPCLSEMPELGELSGEYKEKGVQIIGICTDTLNYDGTANEDQIEAAREIVEKTEAAYLHIVPEGDLAANLLPQIQVVPTTAFVDKNGKQVGAAVSGARDKESWAELIDEMLGELN